MVVECNGTGAWYGPGYVALRDMTAFAYFRLMPNPPSLKALKSIPTTGAISAVPKTGFQG